MKKELEIVQADIKDLEERLAIARQKEKTLKEKISAPDFIGKYFKYNNIDSDDAYLYFYVKTIEDSPTAGYMWRGPSASYDYWNGYAIKQRNFGFCSLDYTNIVEITKEEFDAKLQDVTNHLFD